MDPQKLLFLDKRVVRTIRTTGLIFSISLALICVLVYNGVFVIEKAFLWACLPLAGALTGLGLLEAFWNPYTRQKVSIYINMYFAIGGPLSVLVLSFSTMVFMAWTLLIMIVVIFFGFWRALFGYLIMVLSLIVWLILHAAELSFANMLAYGFSGLAVGILCLLLLNVWRLTNDSIRGMEVAHAKEDYERSQLNSLVNSMADGVIAVDMDAKVILSNAAALNLLDINSAMQGKPLQDYLKLVNEKEEPVNVGLTILSTKMPTVNRDWRIRYQDGSFASLYLSIAPVHLGYGKTGGQGYVLILRDISHEKSLEEERDEFISVVSHELRTPIAITEGEISNAQLITEKTGEPDKIKGALEAAHSQVLFLADMINDLSTLSRAERGVLKLEVEEFSPSDLVNELQANYTKDATDKGLKVVAKAPGNIKTLHSSKLYVREVLQNFITNAIKYTEKGSVTITVKAHKDGIAFTVSDTGIGISKQDQNRVFEKFFRSEDYRTRANNGTGLGLYVTQKLIHLLKAQVEIESKLDKGSSFTVIVPDLKPDDTANSSEKKV